MANNRSILVDEALFDHTRDQAAVDVPDEFQVGLPEELLDEESIKALPAANPGKQIEAFLEHAHDAQETVVSDRIEITQQQLSRGVALVVLASFLVFIVGYAMGSYKVRGEQFAMPELIPAVLFSSFFETDSHENSLGNTYDSGTHEYGRFATLQEADTLRSALEKEGRSTRVVTRTSRTPAGHEYHWFQVCALPQGE